MKKTKNDSNKTLADFGARVTYPIREINEKELQNPDKVEEIVENVCFGQHTYLIKRKNNKNVMMIPIPRKEKLVSVDIELSEQDWVFLAKEAHRRDLTLNQLIAATLSRYIDRVEVKKKVKKRKRPPASVAE